MSVNNRIVGYSSNALYVQQTRNRMVSAPNYQFMHSHSQLNTAHYPMNNDYINQPPNLNLNVPLHEFVPIQPQMVGNTVIKTEIKTEVINEPPPSTSQLSNDASEAGEIDIQIRNMTCHYTLPLHIDLRRIALSGVNCIYDRGRGALTMQRRNPSCYIKIFSSGVVYIVGCKTEMECRKVSRRVGRMVQILMGKKNQCIKMRNYQIKNVLATCKMPFGINVAEIARKYPKESQYEPELFVGLHWKSIEPKASLRIYTTGTVMVTGATSEGDVMRAIENIYDVVYQFRCHRTSANDDDSLLATRKRRTRKANNSSEPVYKRQRTQAYNMGMSSGMVGNKMYFDDEEEDLLDDY
uniref:TATA box-binding protein-like 1 n=1 Tax=Acrobeloides nanus TaxID=290746 RepID=A0A914DEN6_9BILA